MIMLIVMTVVISMMNMVSMMRVIPVMAVVMGRYSGLVSVVISWGMGVRLGVAVVMFIIMAVVVGMMNVVTVVRVGSGNVSVTTPACGILNQVMITRASTISVLPLYDNCFQGGSGSQRRESRLDIYILDLARSTQRRRRHCEHAAPMSINLSVGHLNIYRMTED